MTLLTPLGVSIEASVSPIPGVHKNLYQTPLKPSMVQLVGLPPSSVANCVSTFSSVYAPGIFIAFVIRSFGGGIGGSAQSTVIVKFPVSPL